MQDLADQLLCAVYLLSLLVPQRTVSGTVLALTLSAMHTFDNKGLLT